MKTILTRLAIGILASASFAFSDTTTLEIYNSHAIGEFSDGKNGVVTSSNMYWELYAQYDLTQVTTDSLSGASFAPLQRFEIYASDRDSSRNLLLHFADAVILNTPDVASGVVSLAIPGQAGTLDGALKPIVGLNLNNSLNLAGPHPFLASGQIFLYQTETNDGVLISGANGAYIHLTGTQVDAPWNLSTFTAAPEPASYALIGVGLLGSAALRRIAKSKAACKR